MVGAVCSLGLALARMLGTTAFPLTLASPVPPSLAP
jgi:hypothetical protein